MVVCYCYWFGGIETSSNGGVMNTYRVEILARAKNSNARWVAMSLIPASVEDAKEQIRNRSQLLACQFDFAIRVTAVTVEEYNEIARTTF
jgi:hypothetical protein